LPLDDLVWEDAMHTNGLLSSADISIAVRGRDASLGDVFPGFGPGARLAIVTTQSCGAFGAATLLLAAVASWYDQRRLQGDDFWEYPDFFMLQVGEERADLAELEFWPPSKQPVVEPDAEVIMGALCDRAINYLLVEDGEPGVATVLRETLNAIPRHLRGAVAYSPSGRVPNADIVVRGSEVSERLIDGSIMRSTNVPSASREACRLARRALLDGDTPMETLRSIDIDTALGLLGPRPELGASKLGPLGLSARVREVHGLSPGRLAPITVTVGREPDEHVPA
jgi:hypothetical protein